MYFNEKLQVTSMPAFSKMVGISQIRNKKQGSGGQYFLRQSQVLRGAIGADRANGRGNQLAPINLSSVGHAPVVEAMHLGEGNGIVDGVTW